MMIVVPKTFYRIDICYHKQKENAEEYTLNPQGLPVWKADDDKQRDISIMRNLTSRLSNTQ